MEGGEGCKEERREMEEVEEGLEVKEEVCKTRVENRDVGVGTEVILKIVGGVNVVEELAEGGISGVAMAMMIKIKKLKLLRFLACM